MQQEMITFFTEDYRPAGVSTRQEIHEQGLWHETFHCWLYFQKNEELFLYFQQRASQKRDFPNEFDITAAGHLLAGETILDGLREVEEELGLALAPDELQSIGHFPVEIDLPGFHDKEFTNIFLVEKELAPDELLLQEEEVQGLYAVPMREMESLLFGSTTELPIHGIAQSDGERMYQTKTMTRTNICAHSKPYYRFLFKELSRRRGRHE